MQINVVGVNYSTTPIAIREKLAVSASQLSDALFQLRNYISQGTILSTCNRTEVYSLTSKSHSAKQNSTEF